jgi:hypothetical protein
MFQESPAGTQKWIHTPQSQFLKRDTTGSMRDVVLNFGDVQYKMMTDLHHTVLTGDAAFRRVHGDEFWSWYEKHPEAHAVFDATMQQLGKLGGADAAVAFDVPWKGIDQLVDVGGGHGLQAAYIAYANSHVNATVFDLKHVIARAEEVWSGKSPLPVDAAVSLRSRMTFVAGDAFDFSTVPGARDDAIATAARAGNITCTADVPRTYAYALRDILHDWPDEDCVKILSSLRASMRVQGHESQCFTADGSIAAGGKHAISARSYRVFIVGRLIEPGASFIGSLGSFDADIVMLAAFGTTAGERTVEQYNVLFEAAGLKLKALHRTSSHYAVLEASL